MATNLSQPDPAPSIPIHAGDLSIPVLFERMAASYPQQVAIGSGSWQPTYAELNATADLFAAHLRAGHGPGGRVALLHRLDGFLIGAILAVLKAGQVVAALNPGDPVARLRDDLAETEPWIIVADPESREKAAQAASPGVPVVVFPEPPSIDLSGRLYESHAPEGPEDLSFLIQSSGSTGRSKRVMLTQRVVLGSVTRHNAELQIQTEDRILLLASSSALQALGNIFCALLYGATICPYPVAEKSIFGLGEWIRRHHITIYISAASAFRNFLKTLAPDERFPSIRVVRLGSEAILASDLRSAQPHFRDDCVYYCSYNCSEAGNVLQNRISSVDAITGFRVPLGHAAPDTEICLCDESGAVVSDGEIGEIIVTSKFLSPGYWRDERLTSERFSEGSGGTRSFRTGDLARREPDGSLSFIGRRDDVVKIRGSRVILGEVARTIRSLPGVQESVVLARTLPDGAVRLTAFIVASADHEPSQTGHAETIRIALAALLPGPSVPGEFVFLDRLPLNAAGKIDREALRSRAPSAPPAALPSDSFATPTEVALSSIWREVLGGPADSRANFFHCGGDSLTAGVLAAKVQTTLGVELDMRDFAQHPHLSDLAGAIDRYRESRLQDDAQATALPPIERVIDRSAFDLSFTQEGIWKYCQESVEAHRNYGLPRIYVLRGRLDVEALRDAMTSVVRRNEILRTTFSVVDGKPAQIVHPSEPVPLPLTDVSGSSNPRKNAFALLRQETGSIDLERLPLVRFRLVRVKPEEHWLLRFGHHILYDGLSWNLFFQQLEAEYLSNLRQQAGSAESPSEFNEVPAEDLQFGDYAAWERSVFAPGSALRVQLVDWWKGVLDQQPLRAPVPFRRRWPSGRRANPADGWVWNSIAPEARTRLRDLAHRESTTDYAIGLAAFAALLSAVSRQNKIVVGSYVTRRLTTALQNIMGDFARTLPVCVDCTRPGTFLEFMSAVRKQIIEVQAHAQIPREQLFEDLRSQGIALPEIGFVFRGPRSAPSRKLAGLDLLVDPGRFTGEQLEEIPLTMPWGFRLCLNLKGEEYQCETSFNARRHDPAKVHRFLQSYVRLLELLSASPERPVEDLVGAALAK